VVLLLVNLDVQIAGRTAAGADLALGGQPHPHAVADARGNLDIDLAARPDPAVAATPEAGVQDDYADSPAGGARPRCQHLAEQRALYRLASAWPAAGFAGHGAGAIAGALALALVAQHRGVDGDLLGHAGRALLELQPQAQQRVGARPHPPGGSPRGRSAAEEG